jgi:CBS domain containing-hemolysin-like protein
MVPMTDQAPKSRENHQNVISRVKALFGVANLSLRSEMEVALRDLGRDTDLSPQEREMLKNVLHLHELNVSDVMVPRSDIVGVSLEDTLQDVLKIFKDASHSRLPVYAQSLDDPRGMVHIRDLLGLLTDHFASLDSGAQLASFDVCLSRTGIIRPVLFVPRSMPALELLVKMQAARTHMALVIDEYGGTDGLASIEDIVELIVGEIEDEHDDVEGPLISKVGDGAFIVDARAPLHEVELTLSRSLKELSQSLSVETIGGLVTTVAGRVMAKGERIAIDEKLFFEVVEADPRRLKILKAVVVNSID